MTDEHTRYIEAAAELAASKVETKLTAAIGVLATEFREAMAKQRSEVDADLDTCRQRHAQGKRFSITTWLHSIGIIAAVVMSALSLLEG